MGRILLVPIMWLRHDTSVPWWQLPTVWPAFYVIILFLFGFAGARFPEYMFWPVGRDNPELMRRWLRALVVCVPGVANVYTIIYGVALLCGSPVADYWFF